MVVTVISLAMSGVGALVAAAAARAGINSCVATRALTSDQKDDA